VSELTDRVEVLKGKRQLKREAEAVAKENKRDEMRRQMPGVAKLVDDFRDVFGAGVSVVVASEGGRLVKSDRAIRNLGLSDEVL